ncbi:peptidoglycan D,D-transpeptidase FtsI family protein [Hydromonas duriensis]|uniref:Peptidoglycan D,D-transpeptidase FtsI n=1 Tax=Hydromonas duriensis TaxID=1527608 RepID=A0A4R6Y2R4_9BURK|nr:penicillin-binding protein 2 [Hydromonas duriensis]TDR30831.1 peptidoglycan synthetase FtsI [Hydromonas duriensis]
MSRTHYTPQQPAGGKRPQRMEKKNLPVAKLEQWRSSLLLALIMLAMAVLALWAVWLQVISNDFLQEKGAARYSRLLEIAAPRGKIYDRNMLVLASNVPAQAIWIIPEEVKMTPAQESALAKLLDMSVSDIRKKVAKDDKRFVYLRRQVPQDIADQIKNLKIAGIYAQKEVKRDYPQGDVFAHLTGFTNIEGQGQDGIEWSYNKTIEGKPGTRRVIRDRIGNVIEDEGVVEPAVPGEDVVLSLDARVQYIVFNALREVVDVKGAKSASAMVVDTQTGEVLAMANYPSFDPNSRVGLTGDQLRNRALTDVFEPGSTLKPFAVSLALEQGVVAPTTMIDAQGGKLTIGDATISDSHPNGALTVEQVIQKSSNVGTSKIALKLKPEDMWNMFNNLGFGQSYKVGFPSVAAGILRPYKSWMPIEQATMSYGHGIAMSLLQLTHAYTVFARDGDIIPLTFIKASTADAVQGKKVYSPKTVAAMRKMMEMATEPGGTAPKAQVIGYRVAGKTGTAYKVEGNGYNKNKYVASFAGLAPASKPRIVVTVMVDEPPAAEHFGGLIAAPVFSQIVSETLRTLSVAPDAPYKTAISTVGVEESF